MPPSLPEGPPLSPWIQLWRWPMALGVLTASGLLSALVSDGWGDAWSWIALGLPVAVMLWCGWARRAPSPGRSTAAEPATLPTANDHTP